MKVFVKGDEDAPTEIDVAFLDGYSVGDTLLEGVMFACTVHNGKIRVEVDPSCAKYFSGLNEKRWLAEMTEFANSEDCDSFLANPQGTEDAWLIEN
jgi:hypothetical protein